MEIVRVLRVIEYVGARSWVEETVARSIHGEKVMDYGSGRNRIKAATIGAYPEILERLDAMPEEEQKAPDTEEQVMKAPLPTSNEAEEMARLADLVLADPLFAPIEHAGVTFFTDKTRQCTTPTGLVVHPGDQVQFAGETVTIVGVSTNPFAPVLMAEWNFTKPCICYVPEELKALPVGREVRDGEGVTNSRHWRHLPILYYFGYVHLPEALQATSKGFYDHAWNIVEGAIAAEERGEYIDRAELVAGLRKLLEAKDCCVRAGLARKRKTGGPE